MKQATHNTQLITLMIILFFVSCFMFHVSSTVAQVKLETGLPGHSTVPTETALPSYINYLFVFGLGLITILALTWMIIGGITYILAAGNAAKVEDAKDMIFQALLGVGLLLVSYLLLRTINPDLVNLRNPNLTPTQFRGGPNQQQLVGNEQEIEGAPCTSGEVTGSGRNYAICINGRWANTSNMPD